jgi:hypothetical protein
MQLDMTFDFVLGTCVIIAVYYFTKAYFHDD